jgi:hypothetical protein
MLYGGLYTDIDTEGFVPIETWLQPGCKVALALENALHFCQWTFAASPQHPLIQSVWREVMQHVMTKDFSDMHQHIVHEVTGPAAFTDGVVKYLTDAVGPRVDQGDDLVYCALSCAMLSPTCVQITCPTQCV